MMESVLMSINTVNNNRQLVQELSNIMQRDNLVVVPKGRSILGVASTSGVPKIIDLSRSPSNISPTGRSNQVRPVIVQRKIRNPSYPVIVQREIPSIGMNNQEQVVDTKIPPGLENMGNTCFHNSAVQILYRMTYLRDYMIQNKNNYIGDPSVFSLINLLNVMKQSNGGYLNWSILSRINVAQICSIIPNLGVGAQDDAGGFLQAILQRAIEIDRNDNTIGEYINTTNNTLRCITTFRPPEQEQIGNGWRLTDDISNILENNADEVRRMADEQCIATGDYSVAKTYSNIMFNLKAASFQGYTSIQDCIYNTSLKEPTFRSLDDGFHLAFEKEKLINTSEYFLVNISPITAQNKRTHNLELADDNEQIVVDNYKYNMVGIGLQSGNINGGHYISYIKYGSIWYVYNDKSVSQLPSLAQQLANNKRGDTFLPVLILYSMTDAKVAESSA